MNDFKGLNGKIVPGGFLNGYITIVVVGGTSPSTVFSALKYENSVIFRVTKNGAAENLKKMIDAKIESRK